MEEWKELDIANLPSDILVGDYEFDADGVRFTRGEKAYVKTMLYDLPDGVKYSYRKRKPKQPTHEEIMTKWWKADSSLWFKVVCFYKGKYWSINWDYDESNMRPIGYEKSDFTGRESADIPQEAK